MSQLTATINGYEMELHETAVIYYEDVTWTDAEGKNHYPCRLEVKCTFEGLIIDVWHRDECVATFGATAQELVDTLCH